MTGKGLILDLALLFLLWNLAYGKTYLMSTVDKDFGFPDVQLMTGNSKVNTSIQTSKSTILSYRKKTVDTRTDKQNSSSQFIINGSPVAVYGLYENNSRNKTSFFPVLPISALGTDYIVSTCHPPRDYTSVLVIATHSQGTVASVTFRINGILSFEGQQYSDGSNLTLILDPFETRTITTSADLTGTVVSTRDSVAVYSGLVYKSNLVAYVQLLPVKHYGEEYVVAVDHTSDLYQLQIISNRNDTSIVFNNGSTVCMGESRVYRRQLTRNASLFFVSNTPVMTLVCRVSGRKSGAIVVPPAKSYAQDAAMKARAINIVTEKTSTDVKLNVSYRGKLLPYPEAVDWVEIKGSRYKVGTLRPKNKKNIYISSETSYFTTLVFDDVLFTGGYNFGSKQQTTETPRVPVGVCSEDDNTVTDITTVITPKPTKLDETMTVLNTTSESSLTEGYSFSPRSQTTETPRVTEGVCSEDDNTVTDITTVITPKPTKLDETMTVLNTTSESSVTEGYSFSPRSQTTDTPRDADIEDELYSQLSAELKNIAKFDSNNTDTERDIETVANITAVMKPKATDLDVIVTIFEEKNVAGNITSHRVEKVLEIANNLLKTPTDILSQAQQNNSVANRLIKVVDGITDRLISSTEGETKFITDAFALTVVDLTTNTTPGRLPIGLQVTEGSAKDDVQFLYQSNSSSTTPRQRSAVFFQESFLRHIVNNNTGRNVRLSMNYYSNPVLFTLSENSSQHVLKSKVISAKILVDGAPLTELDNLNITLAFQETKLLTLEDQNSYSCVYWDFSGNDNAGSWSTDGCQFAKYEEQTVCVCDHLTNFAVLTDYYGQHTLKSALALSIITKVGLYLSIAGLSITVISHVLFRDKRIAAETRPSSTLFNLALAQLCSWIVFVVGIDRTENHVGCIVVAALLHYFILASFMWMLAMAVLYYLLLVKVIGTHTTWYMLKTGIPAWGPGKLFLIAGLRSWSREDRLEAGPHGPASNAIFVLQASLANGIPILPVVTLLAVDIELYKGGPTYCWMSLTAFYYAFGAPVCLILLANMGLYIVVVTSICKRTASTARKSSHNRSYLQNIKASFFSFVILGLSWIFGFLAISDATLVFQYIFCVTCSLQGFLIFLFFTLQDQRIRDNWRTLLCGTKARAVRSIRKERLITDAKTSDDTNSPSKYTEDTV